MKKFITLLLLVSILAGGYYWKTKTGKNGKQKDSVTVVKVVKGEIERKVESTGEVTPLNRVEIKPPIAGRIEELLVDEGSRVTKGKILAWLSSSDRAAIMDAARAKGSAELKKWEDTYKPTPIVAPLTGLIILRNVVVGQTVDSSTILFAMSDKLIVTARVDEADIGSIKVGLPARMILDAYPKDPIMGKVFQILFEGKNVSNVITYGVKISPDDVPPYFRSQMTANVDMILDRRSDVLLIPSNAVSNKGSTKEVLIPKGEGVREPHVVETGLDDGQNVEIISGLTEGQEVLLVRKRYQPQEGAQNSPLSMMGGPRGGSGQQSGGSRQRER